MFWNRKIGCVVFVLVFGTVAVMAQSEKHQLPPRAKMMVKKAVAVLHPTKGHRVHGIVTFTVVPGGVRVVADVDGLTPGLHGFHIHEYGDCSAPDGKSAGGHFNPTGKRHGGPKSSEHHIGDLGNIEADASGHAHLDQVFSFLKLMGPTGIIGRAVIIHAGKDDLTSQPSGNAGPRVACGVIGIAH